MGGGTQFDRLFDDFTDEAFRVETLPGYNVGQDAERLAEYTAGAYLPEPPIPGVEFIQELVRPGRRASLVRLVAEPLTMDQRLSIDWVYPHHAAAGREIAILEPGSEPAARAGSVGDFWLFDKTTVAVMHYRSDGSFGGAEVISEPTEVQEYVALRSRLLATATPFQHWLSDWRRNSR